MKRVVVGSHNPNKAKEIRTLLEPLGLEVLGLSDLGEFDEPEENGVTFQENARAKALFFSKQIEGMVLADDSGLEVEALDGRPGVHSKRYSGPEGDHDANNALLLEELDRVPPEKRRAQFRCAMTLAQNGEEILTVEGICRGTIADELRGSDGFGYDPLFIYPPEDRTFGEMPLEEKNRVSHRALALRALGQALEETTTK